MASTPELRKGTPPRAIVVSRVKRPSIRIAYPAVLHLPQTKRCIAVDIAATEKISLIPFAACDQPSEIRAQSSIKL